ncbi:serine/threonine-protein kinase [Streptomyces capillispiralis]|uniref:non-specific serine/threonine protein kinase n=1 Tax=Streptomyces capillispiralis TaxID=68182 RepID=A0A561TF34_9ACTN|nr:serine/threonine-protein kinase [Streptomyces capillispiralis]TWF85720.1 serine/threonine protein kinase [Streptomyces capillispiralis]GHH89861.1 protein kinase [Streptomyces capillispiralis]
MSSNGGAQHGADEPTSFGLQPPHPRPPAAVPHPGNPYAAPTRAVPPQPQPQPQHQDRNAARSQAPAPAPAPESVPAPQPLAGNVAGAATDPGVGRLIAGRYRLLARLGHGGMGTVWRAKDETVDREVAVKEPRIPDHLPERERSNVFERMRREARAAARLDHPAVVNVHDVAVVDGRPWIVMELVQGRSLGAVLQEEGTLPAREAARVGLEVLGALEAAHAAGVLHRDVKPDNVLLGRHERVVLTDFGIARIEGDTDLTDTSGFVGSPEYIAPERVLGQRPGPASDLWSLGVVLYAATEGVSPFRRSNTPATLQSVLNAAPAPPASARGPLAEVITGLLQKDPAHRPNAAQVRAALEAAAHPPAPQPTQAGPLPAPAAGGGGGKGIRIGRGTLTGLAAAVVAGAVAAYLVIADPFAGPLPDGWKRHDLGDRVGAALAVPEGFVKDEQAEDSDGTIASFTDPSGLVRVEVDRDLRSEDEDGEIEASATERAFAHWEELRDGEYSWGIADTPAPRGKPRETTYRDREAATNTIVYTTTTDPVTVREAQVVYYRSKGGDMYRLWVVYPGKGHFAEDGREIARTVVDSWDVHER